LTQIQYSKKYFVADTNLTYSHTLNQFFRPALELLKECSKHRLCPELPDAEWLRLGVSRILMEPASGRGFLQQLGPLFRRAPSRRHFFESLKSRRRLSVCQQLNRLLSRLVHRTQADPLAQFPQLAGYDIYAGDGHWHEAAAHDKPRDTRKFAVGHFYTMNLRSHALGHLDMADEKNRKHEHDMRVLKRASHEQLRQQAPKGRKVLYVWDKACIDYTQWDIWKRRSGIYFMTRAKGNMTGTVLKKRPIDRDDPVNRGVISDELIQPEKGGVLRRIRCVDPLTGDTLTFLTNELTLPPGLLAQLYRMRWDLEKVFDQFKNSLNEKKSWASSATAKTMQATFLCLTHNLMLLMEATLKKSFGVDNLAEIKRRQKRLLKMKAVAAAAGREVSAVYDCVQRFTKRSLKFIRWLRLYFFRGDPLRQAADCLRTLYATS
jgi:hypothetical protein